MRRARRPPISQVSLAVFAVVLAVAAAAWVSFVPCWSREVTSESVSGSGSGGTTGRVTVECRTLLESEGRVVVSLLVVPISLALLGWYSARTGRPVLWSGLGLVLFSALALPTIGLFFLPAAVAMLIASIKPRVRDDPGPA